MYLTLRGRPDAATSQERPVRKRVARTVILLGIVSMVTDISTESVNSVLPNYLIVVVGLSPQAFGVVNGLYNGVSALVRIASGWLADRTDHPKFIAALGDLVSAVSKVALLGAHSFGAFSAIATADQLGKGVRTAPRDSMIAASSSPDQLGRAFGVHRTLDTLGAFIGPLLAFWILTVVPNGFHSVFVISLAFAVIGVAILALVVPDVRPRRQTMDPGSSKSRSDRAKAPKTPAPKVSLRLLATPAMAKLLSAAGLLGLLSIGETYVFFELQARDNLALKYYTLMVVGMNLAYILLAIPLGRLADRVGRWKVFIGGYCALVLAYVAAGGALSGTAITLLSLVLLGAYYAATDGVLAAMAGRAVQTSVRASGIATAQTVLAAASFFSSLGFALLWVGIGRGHALLVAAAVLAVVIPVAAVLLRGVDGATRAHESTLAQ
jgi:MFS family permease